MTSRLGPLASMFIIVATLVVACGGDDESPSSTPALTATAPAAENAASPPTEPSPPPASPQATEAAAPPSPGATEMTNVPIGEQSNPEVYVMNADGSEQQRLTDMPTIEAGPVWSPDGTMLAFGSHDGRTPGGILHVMNADGSGLRQIHSGVTSQPAWSPDGRWIVVSSIVEDVQREQIVVVAVDGTGATRLTSHENVPTASLSMGNIEPGWSPDGQQIVFVAMQLDGPNEIHVMNADGSNVRRLTDSPGNKWQPVWSPDGTQIAFMNDSPLPEIWIMNADGTDQRNVTNDPAVDLGAAWSPDGAQLAFVRQTESTTQIMAVDADGSNLRTVADGLPRLERLRWSPDGTQIAYAPSDPSGNLGIFIVNAGGGEPLQLTDPATGDSFPDWSPDGSKIAFVSMRDGGPPSNCSWISMDELIAVENVEALSWMSRLVVAGTVVEELGSAFGGPGPPDMDGARTIYTDYVLEVDQQYRGAPLERVQIRVTGGTIGDCVQTTEPTVNLTQGTRVMLFLFEEHVDGALPPAYLVSVVGAWMVGDDETLTSPDIAPNPVGIDGLTVEAVGAMVSDALAGPPSPDAYWVVSLEESPATQQ